MARPIHNVAAAPNARAGPSDRGKERLKSSSSKAQAAADRTISISSDSARAGPRVKAEISEEVGAGFRARRQESSVALSAGAVRDVMASFPGEKKVKDTAMSPAAAPREGAYVGQKASKLKKHARARLQSTDRADAGSEAAGDDRGQSAADGDCTDAGKSLVGKRKRKRVACWTIEQITSSKEKLLKELQSNRETLSKSRLKRLRARLALLAKAEQGEAQVGGQLAKSKKRKKKPGADGGSSERGVQGRANKRRAEALRRSSVKQRDARLSGSQKRKLQRVCLRCKCRFEEL